MSNHCHMRGSLLSPLAKPLRDNPLMAIVHFVDNAKDAHASKVQIRWTQTKHELILKIFDNGSGMNEEGLQQMLHFGTSSNKGQFNLRHHGVGFKLAATAISSHAYIITSTAAAYFSEPWTASAEHVKRETCNRIDVASKQLKNMDKNALQNYWNEHFPNATTTVHQGTLIVLHLRHGVLVPSADNSDLIAYMAPKVKRQVWRPKTKESNVYAADYSLRELLKLVYAEKMPGITIELNGSVISSEYAKLDAQCKHQSTFLCDTGAGKREIVVKVTDRSKGALLYHNKRLVEYFCWQGKFLHLFGVVVEADCLNLNLCKTAFEQDFAWHNFIIGLDMAVENCRMIGNHEQEKKNIQCSECQTWHKPGVVLDTSKWVCKTCEQEHVAHYAPMPIAIQAPVNIYKKNASTKRSTKMLDVPALPQKEATIIVPAKPLPLDKSLQSQKPAPPIPTDTNTTPKKRPREEPTHAPTPPAKKLRYTWEATLHYKKKPVYIESRDPGIENVQLFPLEYKYVPITKSMEQGERYRITAASNSDTLHYCSLFNHLAGNRECIAHVTSTVKMYIVPNSCLLKLERKVLEQQQTPVEHYLYVHKL